MTDVKQISDEILNFLQKSKIRKETCNDVVNHLKTIFPDEFFANRYNAAIKELIRDGKITTINCVLCLTK